MEDAPFFSIFLILSDFTHMAHWSFESILAQSFPSFEVFVLEKEPSSTIRSMGEKGGVKVHFLTSNNKNISVAEFLNKAIEKAKGKYIHVLQPGDFYLSSKGLEYVKQEIDKKPGSDLIYCSYLVRDEIAPPKAISYPISSQFLQKGKMPSRLQCCWFSKEIFAKVGLFNPKYARRPGLDFLCRVFLHKGCQFSSFKRVIVDYEPVKASSAQVIGYALETFKVIFHYFGIIKAISWWFSKEHPGFFRWGKDKVHKIFFKP